MNTAAATLQPGICDVKVSLVIAYQAVTQQYADKLNELERTMGVLTKKNYRALYGMMQALHSDAINAKAALETHVEKHGC